MVVTILIMVLLEVACDLEEVIAVNCKVTPMKNRHIKLQFLAYIASDMQLGIIPLALIVLSMQLIVQPLPSEE